ncbi:C-type mannose receptor 2-like, partial [Astyanax mexicanus]
SSPQRQYHLITDQKNWTDAQTYCREHYADLATAENDRDMNKIQREAQRLSFTSDAWVGLYNDIKSWRCSHDELPPGWTRWGPYQPNNVYGKDECVSMFQDGTWNDFPCLTPYPFVCYDEKISGSDKYVYYSAGKTWKEAQDYCRQKHTDLACPSDDPQNSIIQNKILTQWTWIGFYRDGWKWSDNTSVTSIKWSLFQPDNFGGNQYCARLISIVFSEFSGIMPGWFDDLLCADLHAFFCQSLPAEKKVVRLVVKSDQDMNDPTVRAALLEKMQQTLEEQGMEVNATLRWREQSDGTVFYKQEEKKSENVENNTVTICEL